MWGRFTAVVATLAVSSLASANPSSPSDAPLERVQTTGGWTVVIPSSFTRIDNGDSWQFHDEARVVYVSSLSVKDKAGRKVSASVLCAEAGEGLGKAAGKGRLRFDAKKHRGEAEIRRAENGWELKAFMCADGTLATCVIDYSDERDRDWAVKTWQSLRRPRTAR